jgi:hypothetical protein
MRKQGSYKHEITRRIHSSSKLYHRDLDCMADVLMGFHQYTFSKLNTEFNLDLAPCDFWAFPTMKRELRRQEILK